MRRVLIFLIAVMVLAVINFEIYKKEKLLVEGTTLLLELAPVDPRSLMQGDYMILRYKIAREHQKIETDGYFVIERDSKQVGHFKEVYKGELPESSLLLRVRKRRRGIRMGAESFFFQEGHAKYYNEARYGELRVSATGDSVLIGLRNADLKRLGPPIDNPL